MKELLISFTMMLAAVACSGFALGCAMEVGELDEYEDTSQANSAISPLSVPFKKGKDGYDCYRTPAIVKAKNGDLLAFAGGRKGGCGDDTDCDIVLRRSTDGGATWKPMQVLDKGAGDPKNRAGLPNPVVLDSGEIILLYVWSKYASKEENRGCRRVYQMTSSDHGKTWSSRKNITGQTQRKCEEDSKGRWVDPPAAGNWGWTGLGPVHGIVKKFSPNKGRIIFGGRHVSSDSKSYAHVIYSDDGGSNWKIGGSLDMRSSESTVVELPNGKIMLNARSVSGSKRIVGISSDGGQTFEPAFQDAELPEPGGKQGSLLRYGDKILFSNPSDSKVITNGTIQVSSDNGDNWSKGKTYTPSPEFSGYSDMVRVGGDIGVLVEWGSSQSKKHEQIRFLIVKKSDLGL